MCENKEEAKLLQCAKNLMDANQDLLNQAQVLLDEFERERGHPARSIEETEAWLKSRQPSPI
jgi:hypothetical protein